ncbi:MAG: flagellar hook-associated protein FlgL, partial [Gemmatimonadetes bacterium]|nr:flagellar hook-associated protein FlgL [Gemmatimonadota bacterium]
MRITNNIIRENAVTNMRRGLQQMEAAQQRLGTGLRLTRASDDPAATATALRTRGSINALEQHRRSIDVAKLRTTSEETALGQISDLLTRAKELAISQATATASASTRRAAGAEVEGLLRQAVSIGNTRIAGDYLFGGMSSDVRPFDVDESGASLGFTSTGPTGALSVEISAKNYLATTHSGVEVLGTDTVGVLASIRDLASALGSNDLQGITNALSSIDSAFETVQSLNAETGARYNQLDITRANLDAVELNEAFAVQVLACARRLGLDLETLNADGGAIALGHALGSSGCRMVVTLLG